MPGFACGLSMCVLGIPVASLQIPGTPRPGLLDWARLPVPVSPSRHPAIGHAQVRVTGGRSFRVSSVIDQEECGLKRNVAPIQVVSSHRRRSASNSKCKPSLPWVDDRRCDRGSEQPVSHARGNRCLEPLHSWPSGHGEKRQIRQISTLSPLLTAERAPHLVTRSLSE